MSQYVKFGPFPAAASASEGSGGQLKVLMIYYRLARVRTPRSRSPARRCAASAGGVAALWACGDLRGAGPPFPGLGRERARSAAGGAAALRPQGAAESPGTPARGRSAPSASQRRSRGAPGPRHRPARETRGASLAVARWIRACRPVPCAAGGCAPLRGATPKERPRLEHPERPGSASAPALLAGRELRGEGADGESADREGFCPTLRSRCAAAQFSAQPKPVRASPSLTRWSSERRVVGGSYISRSF